MLSRAGMPVAKAVNIAGCGPAVGVGVGAAVGGSLLLRKLGCAYAASIATRVPSSSCTRCGVRLQTSGAHTMGFELLHY